MTMSKNSMTSFLGMLVAHLLFNDVISWHFHPLAISKSTVYVLLLSDYSTRLSRRGTGGRGSRVSRGRSYFHISNKLSYYSLCTV